MIAIDFALPRFLAPQRLIDSFFDSLLGELFDDQLALWQLDGF